MAVVTQERPVDNGSHSLWPDRSLLYRAYRSMHWTTRLLWTWPFYLPMAVVGLAYREWWLAAAMAAIGAAQFGGGLWLYRRAEERGAVIEAERRYREDFVARLTPGKIVVLALVYLVFIAFLAWRWSWSTP